MSLPCPDPPFDPAFSETKEAGAITENQEHDSDDCRLSFVFDDCESRLSSAFCLVEKKQGGKELTKSISTDEFFADLMDSNASQNSTIGVIIEMLKGLERDKKRQEKKVEELHGALVLRICIRTKENKWKRSGAVACRCSAEVQAGVDAVTEE